MKERSSSYRHQRLRELSFQRITIGLLGLIPERGLEKERQALVVKAEMLDESGRLGKRHKCSAHDKQHDNLLEGPSPLGLRLRKSPSLMDLIQMRLHQASSSSASCITNCENLDTGIKDLKSTAISGTTEKMKASNFPASLLRIGTWERVSKHEGDLVAKCYFAKHKLVWEVLEGGLKSKIEIQWSEIAALKATFPEDGPGALDIVLVRPPLFFKETNPQPRKHTLWQAISDFTGGQASRHRRHYLQCPQGFLNKHFEKLIQCDPRLHALSQHLDIVVDNPYFEAQCSAFEDLDELKGHGFDKLTNDYRLKASDHHDQLLSSAAPAISVKYEIGDWDDPSPSSDTCSVNQNDCCGKEDLKDPTQREQLKLAELKPSLSTLFSCNSQLCSHECSASKDTLEELKNYLLSDSLTTPASDERRLMSKVNSLCCLLQKDSTSVQSLEATRTYALVDDNGNKGKPSFFPGLSIELNPLHEISSAEAETNDVFPLKQTSSSISRKDSFGDLLLHLPRVASLPQFFFDVKEDDEYQTSPRRNLG
ncbi:hypothetical protein HPP92_020159 [Vanilla planifolia]|uniref:TRF2/HOY1 PH-like domain-containing protein n=1 Tax=Vanilla planifolia TaxID=51239 RepID=A0A835Q479_VANPL|nr:hypothetical protein HPP92_020159 [Vanilla planifolia]